MDLWVFVVVAVLFALLLRWRKRSKGRHQRNIKAGYRVLDKLNEIPSNAYALSYLRSINAYMFEEVILNAVERHRDDVKVIRNKRYSGDGGIDGRLRLPCRGTVYVQAKRYKGHIDAQHVRAFAKVVRRRRGKAGLFVHTGRTGKLARKIALENNIYIVSGDRLLGLLREGHLPQEMF